MQVPEKILSENQKFLRTATKKIQLFEHEIVSWSHNYEIISRNNREVQIY